MKKILSLLKLGCFALVAVQAGAVGWFTMQGTLNSENIQEIRAILSGHEKSEVKPVTEERAVLPSRKEIAEQRSLRVLSLNERGAVLTTIQGMIAKEAQKLADERSAFEQTVQTFDDRVQQVDEDNVSAANEQSRGILKAMKPAEAVQTLMTVPKEKAVVLMKGLPNETVARLLQDFLKGTPEQVQRGEEIFAEITAGEPKNQVIEELQNATPTEGTP